MIKEDLVSIETAKLLTDKGFDGLCAKWVSIDDETGVPKKEYYRPSQSMALKWLRVEHNIYITIGMHFHTENDITTVKFQGLATSIDRKGRLEETGELIDSYQEATEAAIQYCLEYLLPKSE